MNIAIPFAAVTQLAVPTVGFNNNFTEVANKFNTYAVQTDVAKVITVAHTFTVAQNFAGMTLTGDLLFTDATYDIGKTGATRPRDGFFSRNMVVGGTLNLTGALTAGANAAFTTNLSITGAAGSDRLMRWQTNGTARWLLYANSAAEGGADAGSTLILGAYNDAGANIDSPIVILRAAGGICTISRPLQPSGGLAGNITISTGALIFGNTNSKIVPGATQFSHRNNADAADNLLISDAGVVTVRAGLTITAGGITVSSGNVTLTTGGLILTAGGAAISIGGNQVLGPRAAGWATQTGAQTRADMGGAPTLATVASTLDALIMDLRGHGMI